METELIVAEEHPGHAEPIAIMEQHLAFARRISPPEHVHALDIDGLLHPSVTFVGARADGVLLGVGALRELDSAHAEIKSMHTTAAARGRGVGAAIVRHLLELARFRGYGRVSLETGTDEAFAPARRLYTRQGFLPCPPFAEYTDNPFSTCMTRELVGGEAQGV